nr:zinc finger, CCHC-type [Tanacetum cinerariifolium]
MPGRPRKLRIKHVTERVNVITRSGRMMTCHSCWEKGHNKKGCNQEKQPKLTVEKRTPGRKKAGSNFGFQTCDKDGGDADPSSAGPSVGDPYSAGPSVADSTQTITEDPIVADPTNDIPTQQSKTSDIAKIIEDAIATGRLKTAGLKRRESVVREHNRRRTRKVKPTILIGGENHQTKREEAEGLAETNSTKEKISKQIREADTKEKGHQGFLTLQDLDEMTLEEAIGRLKTYEERIKYKKGKQVDDRERLMFTRHEGQGKRFRKRGRFNQSR